MHSIHSCHQLANSRKHFLAWLEGSVERASDNLSCKFPSSFFWLVPNFEAFRIIKKKSFSSLSLFWWRLKTKRKRQGVWHYLPFPKRKVVTNNEFEFFIFWISLRKITKFFWVSLQPWSTCKHEEKKLKDRIRYTMTTRELHIFVRLRNCCSVRRLAETYIFA